MSVATAAPAPDSPDASLVVWRTLAAIPLVAVLVLVALTPVDVFLVGGDIRQHRLLGFWRHPGLPIARLGHTSIVRGAWMEWGGRSRASGQAIEEARP